MNRSVLDSAPTSPPTSGRPESSTDDNQDGTIPHATDGGTLMKQGETLDPFCHDCQTFHRPGRCDEIQARRAKVVPINVKQLSISGVVDDPLQLCRTCIARVPLSALSETGQCSECAVTLEELLAESLRQRGIEPATP